MANGQALLLAARAPSTGRPRRRSSASGPMLPRRGSRVSYLAFWLLLSRAARRSSSPPGACSAPPLRFRRRSGRPRGCYLLLTAPLFAAVQILLYTGGVLTLVVFALVVIAGADAEGGAGGVRCRRLCSLGRVRRPAPRPCAGVRSALADARRRACESGKAVGLAALPRLPGALRAAVACCCSARCSARCLIARKDRTAMTLSQPPARGVRGLRHRPLRRARPPSRDRRAACRSS